jgi:hypothetical protein
MNRFDGYNRHDFHYPNTSREAFGSNFHVEEKKSSGKEVLFYVCIVALVLLKLALV